MTVGEPQDSSRPIIPPSPDRTDRSVEEERRLAIRRIDLAARLIEDSAFVFARQSEPETTGELVRLSATLANLAKSLAGNKGRGNP